VSAGASSQGSQLPTGYELSRDWVGVLPRSHRTQECSDSEIFIGTHSKVAVAEFFNRKT
jgi:hypothetical protein